MPDISVVIPVYNTGLYLQQCLDSFFVETFLDLEIIAFDDCSKDDSLAILKKNALAHPNLAVIENDVNRGPAFIRNAGILRASGKYVYFCDSDDSLDIKGLETLFRMAEKEGLDDAIGYRYQLIERTGEHVYNRLAVRDSGTVTGKEFLFISMTDKLQGIGPWQNLYRRQFLLDHGLTYSEGTLQEDNEFMTRFHMLADRVHFIDLPFYCYRVRAGARSTSPDFRKHAASRLLNLRSLGRLIESNRTDRRTILALRNMLAFNLAHLIRSASMLPPAEQRIIFQEIRDGRYIAEAVHSTRRRTRFFALCAMASLRLTCACYGIYAHSIEKSAGSRNLPA